MNYDHAATAELSYTAEPVAHADVDVTEPITGWHAITGLPLGILRGLAPGTDVEVCVERVIEQATDLAVADRVAWVLSGRTGRQHVVLAAATGYLVATVSPMLDWAAAMRMEPGQYSPRIVSVASPEGVLPVLLPMTA